MKIQTDHLMQRVCFLIVVEILYYFVFLEISRCSSAMLFDGGATEFVKV